MYRIQLLQFSSGLHLWHFDVDVDPVFYFTGLPIMMTWSAWALLVVAYLVCCQWHCEAEVYHVSFLASNSEDMETRFAAVTIALEQYLKDHAEDTILSKSMFKYV